MCLRSGVSKVNGEQQEIRCGETEQETERERDREKFKSVVVSEISHSFTASYQGRPVQSTSVDMSSSVNGKKKDTDNIRCLAGDHPWYTTCHRALWDTIPLPVGSE